MYLIWEILVLGTIPAKGNQSFETISHLVDMGVFVKIIGSKIDFPLFSSVVRTFTLFAIITSFIGVALGLINYFIELFEMEDVLSSRLKVSLLTFSIPLLVVFFYPKIFVQSLAIAAAFLSIVSVIIPSIISLKIISKNNNTIFANRSIPFLLLISGITLVILQGYIIIT